MHPTEVTLSRPTGTAAEVVMTKLEAFFGALPDEERAVISDLVHASLVHAASSGAGMPEYAKALTGRTAPSLVATVSVPGSVRAYSHVNCGQFLVR